ncbi:NCS2 family permease [Lachnobacterium bovis]|jgi:AGZA family xanthine/uracil permease-like MFS transporter|uniref:Putative MFS transporter, AGZA family, xanthine/uracil permease n=1 Tax=Lachnobacterium bovis DSM 14045 TaxID=1122142 RepID=A0A1H3LUG4_9FIRM|nr:NCS2 family permease [Lachnobacterium bovis]SDY68000.1 putative MFS transporter, AGZA family, xanthine/uracil permease [Lachnobacterium bovis DSM 14045]
MLEKMFHLKENNTTVRREVVGGITTFMTMAYILALNPTILSAAKGMDKNAILMATALAAFVGTMAMALLANYPFALAPGLGLNAYFAYTVCGTMGYSYKVALLAVFAEGIIFIVLSLTNIREAIFNAIPTTLKKGVSVGIGLFVAFIGLQGAKIVVDGSTLVTIVNFKENFRTVGICALLAIIGLLVIVVLNYYRVRGSLLFGILITWILGMLCEVTGIYAVGEGTPSLIPTLSSFDVTSIGKTFGQCFDSKVIGTIKPGDFVVIIFAFLFVDIFDTLGTLVGVATKANLLDEKGKLPRIKPALLADAIATTAGAIFGTSTTTTFVESTAGVAEGARTGLASVVTGLLFLVSIVLSPIFIAIPSFATAPALIYVGFLMISSVVDIDFSDLTEAIPAYLAIIAMPLTYSISEGIAFGVISYTVLNVCAGKFKKVTPLMYVLSILFVLKYIFL